MAFHFKKKDYGTIYRRLAILVGVIVNVLFAMVINCLLGLPLYLDTVGTIFVAVIAGLFPAVLTAMITNMVLSIIIPNALYYAIISV
ncbi:MAG: diguanylate cyclase, partial [Pseudobutyrivibrio sp.]|nr:diguanylate cyclase [Pseudobutyrivibrio sp.]